MDPQGFLPYFSGIFDLKVVALVFSACQRAETSGRPSAPNICTHSASVVAAYSARRFVEQAVSSVYPEPPDGQQEEQPAPCLYSYFWVIQSRLEFTSPPAKRLEVTDLVSSVSDT